MICLDSLSSSSKIGFFLPALFRFFPAFGAQKLDFKHSIVIAQGDLEI